MAYAVIVGGALAASCAHVLTGPDHLAAVLPLAVEQRRRAALVGAWWGLGHGLGVVLLGALAHVARGRAHLASIAGLGELMVGVLLVVLGVRAVRRSHGHDHGRPHRHGRGAFGFGVLHGAAGGGHLFVVLPSLALSAAAAAVYLSVYLASAVLVMTAFAMVCGGALPARAVPRALRGSGVLAVVIGVFWIGAALVAA